MKNVRVERDADSIVHLVMCDPGRRLNVLSDEMCADLDSALVGIEGSRDSISGVVISSGHSTFLAGADIKEILALDDAAVEILQAKVSRMKALHRRMERLGKPVVAAINGSALGGGYELCLACHYRVAIDAQDLQIGLPEVTLGLMPGGGGVARLVRLLGVRKALPLLLEGTTLDAASAKNAGLVNEVVPDRETMYARARAWILANSAPVQPWDSKQYRFADGALAGNANSSFVTALVAKLHAKTRGLQPAPIAIVSAAMEGVRVDFDAADRIEGRYFVRVATSQVARNMLTTHLQTRALKKGGGAAQDDGAIPIQRVGVLGAGMMGSGIAWAAAASGFDVVLKDITQEQANKGKAYSDQVAQRLVEQRRLAPQERERILARIRVTTQAAELRGCSLVIEAVFEDRALKARVTQEAEAQLAAGAILASNTSTLPITGLASATQSPDRFIGLHFFSPVDRMPLVEIICGELTSEATLARARDFVRRIGKIPIVVNDSRGFFTSRVYQSFCDEGAWLLEDGVEAALVDNLAQHTGMPAGPLAAVDAVSQQLLYAVKVSARDDARAAGKPFPEEDEPPFQWVRRMVEDYGRRGKAHGGGYFDYPAQGSKRFWPELRRLQPAGKVEVPLRDIKDRILYRQSIEAVRCLEERVLRSVADGNVGSILGIGFPAWTGGQLQYINSCGVAQFCARADELAQRYGKRFAAPDLLRRHAADRRQFV